MSEIIKVGDVVILKRKVMPRMTVERIHEDEADLVWFDAKLRLHRDTIEVGLLEVVPEPVR